MWCLPQKLNESVLGCCEFLDFLALAKHLLLLDAHSKVRVNVSVLYQPFKKSVSPQSTLYVLSFLKRENQQNTPAGIVPGTA
jgi:hypothetical protein